MTHNIETALGVTGVEGIFRLSCEQVGMSGTQHAHNNRLALNLSGFLEFVLSIVLVPLELVMQDFSLNLQCKNPQLPQAALDYTARCRKPAILLVFQLQPQMKLNLI